MSEHQEVKHTSKNNLVNIWNQHQKTILSVVFSLLVVVAGWFGYKELIIKPKAEKAAEALYKAEQYFAQDSSNLVLNGDGQSKGVLYIIDHFGGTPSANLAKYYAGISYLKQGDFNNAVKYLNDFSTPAKQIQLLAYGALGDAYSELNKMDEAVSHYKKAASHFEQDENNSSEYLFRAALLLETNGKTAEAITLYKELKSKFPKTEKGFQADKYINRLSIEKN